MIKLLSKFIFKLSRVFILISKKIYQDPQEKRVIPWFKIRGDKTLRLDYDLNEKSIVFDLGGYEGQWTNDVFSRYCCFIYVFEPVEEFFKEIEKRFSKNKKISVYKFGLSKKTQSAKISTEESASSIFKREKETANIKLLKASNFLQERNIEQIDLMKINIEGGEYDLLEHLIETGIVRTIKNIQVQFHDFVPNAEQRMVKIQKELQKTHYLTYQYPFVWENWRIKKE